MTSPSSYSTFSSEESDFSLASTMSTPTFTNLATTTTLKNLDNIAPPNCLEEYGVEEQIIEEYGCLTGKEFMAKRDSFTDPAFYVEGVSISVLGILGIFGNLLALIVLSRPNLRDVFHQLLFAVASFDLMYIVVGGVNYTFKAFNANSDVYVYLYPHIIHPFTHIAATGVIFMTVAITIERYLGLCHPFLPHTSRKAWYYVVPVVIISVTMNVPKFLEIEHRWDPVTDPETNKTIEMIAYRSTLLRTQENYIVGYQMWTRLICDCVIPVMILLYLNTKIILALISATKVQRFNSARRQRKEINLTLVLLCIVFIFFCCHAARIILDVHEFLNVDKVIACQQLHKCTKKPFLWLPNSFFFFLPKVSHLMQILNSSTNFIVYCLVGHTFRRELYRTFGIRRYSSVPNYLRGLAYENSTFGTQAFTSRKGSRNDDKEVKKKQFDTRNGKNSLSSPNGDAHIFNQSILSKNGTAKMNGTHGCNGHPDSNFNHHPRAVQIKETGVSFPMTIVPTSMEC